ncbi:hypothetical protein [Nocardioides sp.]|uniref:hypothetical protein n=1 Tax=Nocardioides sp. TaxID=35761 RepID=UPI0026128912|nr:hypothetical protein [Nocardioides sp.]MCW2736032.1 hypothetical protein [Nocardioides sp.]
MDDRSQRYAGDLDRLTHAVLAWTNVPRPCAGAAAEQDASTVVRAKGLRARHIDTS